MNTKILKAICVTVMLFAVAQITVLAQNSPKREFRGVWMQCVNGTYLNKSPEQIRQMLSQQLDAAQSANLNVVMFQVRAEGDALYKSSYEPWSRYLTGVQGQAPRDGWDPLGWMVDECHKRGMECHAWINPYRAKTKGTTALAPNHAAVRHPERVFKYGDLMIFNPAMEENRMYTCMVIEDILTHYDVDGIHMDDYFYPYPEAGKEIPDESLYAQEGKGFATIGDWRRNNVNELIKDIHHLIRNTKPWVQFGISPFGIYRNSSDMTNNKNGSATKGLQNYDDLYADIILWQKEGWIDYVVPQIYWNIGTKAADYEVLCRWWNDYCNNRPLIIGQDIERTVKGTDPNNPSSHQMGAKYDIQRSLKHISGSCQWYAAALANNPGNYLTALKSVYHKRPALLPDMDFIDKKKPGKPSKAKIVQKGDVITLEWTAPKFKSEKDRAVNYVVYDFKKGEKTDISHGDNIIKITPDNRFTLDKDYRGHTLVVTSIDRTHNESKGLKIKL